MLVLREGRKISYHKDLSLNSTKISYSFSFHLLANQKLRSVELYQNLIKMRSVELYQNLINKTFYASFGSGSSTIVFAGCAAANLSINLQAMQTL